MITPTYEMIPLSDIQLITKNDKHIPSEKSLKQWKRLKIKSDFYLNIYRWNGELFYVDNFYKVAFRKSVGILSAYAHIIEATSREQIVYSTLTSSYEDKVGLQKLNQFRFDLVQELGNQNVKEIEKYTGLTEKQINKFSFHEDMSHKGRLHAVKNLDLSMMNKIWSSPVLCAKAPHIRPYLETLRIKDGLSSVQLNLIEKYCRSVNIPFQKRKGTYINQMEMLLTQKEPREQILFKEVEMKGFRGKFPPAA